MVATRRTTSARRVATIYLGPTSPSTSVRPTWCSAGSLQTHRLGLAPEGVCLAAAVPSRNLIPKPAGLSFAEAACLPTAWLTAYGMLFVRGALRPGQRAPHEQH